MMLWLSLITATSLALAQPVPTDAAGTALIKLVKGYPKVRVESRAGELRQAEVNATIYEGDKITTSVDQAIMLAFDDNSEVIVGPGSGMVVESVRTPSTEQPTTLMVAYGVVRAWVKNAYRGTETFILRTPASVMGVRGTKFVAEIAQGSGDTVLHTLEGRVAFAAAGAKLDAPSSSVLVAAGQKSSIRAGARPNAAESFDATVFRSDLRKRVPLFEQLLSASAGMPSVKPGSPSDLDYNPLSFPTGLKPKK